jgi:hypothetical protein
LTPGHTYEIQWLLRPRPEMRKRTRELDSQQREDHPPASHAVYRAETQEAKDFFEELTLLRPEGWQNGWTSYGYRIEPVIDSNERCSSYLSLKRNLAAVNRISRAFGCRGSRPSEFLRNFQPG